MILLDTSGLLAAIDGSQRQHDAARRALESAAPPWCLSPFVLAGLDYLLATRVSQEAERALLARLDEGSTASRRSTRRTSRPSRLIGRYRDLENGLADASLVVLANRYGVRDLLTLDERHFRTLHAAGGRPFRLLPADSA